MNKAVLCYTSFNRLNITKQTLPLLLKNTSDNTKIYVVDNGSQKETVEYLRNLHLQNPKFTLILFTENKGISAAMNFVMRNLKKDEFFVKFDNDTIVNEYGWDLWFMECMRNHPEFGQLGGKIVPNVCSKDNAYHLHRSTDFITWDKKTIEVVGEIYGNLVMISPLAIDKIGYFRELEAYGYEDADYSKRLTLAGFKQAYVDGMGIGHLHMESEDTPEHLKWKAEQVEKAKAKFFYYYHGYDIGFPLLIKNNCQIEMKDCEVLS